MQFFDHVQNIYKHWDVVTYFKTDELLPTDKTAQTITTAQLVHQVVPVAKHAVYIVCCKFFIMHNTGRGIGILTQARGWKILDGAFVWQYPNGNNE